MSQGGLNGEGVRERKKCSQCEKPVWKPNARRCEDHKITRPTAEDLLARGIRPPKPLGAAQWCEPCREYVYNLVHRPIRREA